jgi:class 3 adenylate cyclase
VEGKRRGLRLSLQGTIPTKKLENLLENPAAVSLEASERVLSLMFVDVVGFSAAAERQTPKEAFSQMRALVGRITQIVHAHGGVVDRTLGDGMLCVFGYELDDTTQVTDHADEAVRCAIEIQSQNIALMPSTEKEATGPFYPLRIGINTAGVFVGNLGGRRRIDITVIGDGVNFAQRLEAACESHRIMLGASTLALLLQVQRTGPPIQKRLIPLKHHADAVEAYELNPFWNQPELLREERADIPVTRCHLPVMTDVGPGEVTDISEEYLILRLSRYLGKGLQVRIYFEKEEAMGISFLLGEVNWGQPTENGYYHRLQVKGLERRQLALKSAAQ